MKRSLKLMHLSVRVSEKEGIYYSNLCVASSQVFLGVAAATLFTGSIDFGKMLVVILNFVLAISIAILGRWLLK